MKRIFVLLMALMMLVSCLPAIADTAAPDPATCSHKWLIDPSGEQTCTTGCRAFRYCTVCYIREETTLPPLGHDWGEWKTNNATCTKDGEKERTCRRCGLTEKEKLPALGHDWGEWKTTTPAACTKDGEKERACKRCGLTEKEKLPKLGHDYGPWEVTLEPTCTGKGVKLTKCRRCGQPWDEDVAPLGHEMGEWYRVKDPTPEAPGLEQRDCIRGDLSEYRDVPYEGPDEIPLITPETVYPDPVPPTPVPGIIDMPPPDAPSMGMNKLTLTGSIGLPDPMPAAGINLPFNLTITNAGDFPLHSLKVYVTGQDGSGDKFLFGLDNTLFYEEPASSIMDPSAAVNTSYSIYVSEHYLDDMPSLYSFTFVATAVTPDGQPVTSNEWTYCPDVYEMNEPFLITEEYSPAYAAPVLGAVVPVTVRITNTSDFDLSIIGLDNTDLNGFIDNPWYLFFGVTVDGVNTDQVHPGESFTHTFEYVITQDDLDAGMIIRQVWGNGRVWVEYAGQMYCVPAAHSNDPIIVVPLCESMLTVVKAETSTPTYPMGYTLGEQVTYAVVVTNHSTVEMKNVEVHDPLSGLPNNGHLGTVSIQPGQSESLSFTYTVDEMDVQTGSVANQAFAVLGNDTAYSNIVTVMVLDGLPEPTVEKFEVSQPANHEYYQLGEKIDYVIRVSNNSWYVFHTVYVSDWLNDEMPVLLDMIERLFPGDVHEYSYSHVVTEADVDRGYVENFATADWAYNDEFNFQVGIVDSNVVISPTNKVVPPTPPTTFDPDPKDGYRPCTLTLEDVCDEGAMYDQYICVEHQPYAVKAAAATPAEARAIWNEALEEMYSKAYDAASNAEVRMALLGEKTTFYGFLTATETGLKASGASAQTVDETICKLMKRQCTDLCYLVHTAPAARADSYVGKTAGLTAEVTAACGLDLYYTTDSDEYYMVNLCAAHSKAHAAMLKNLAASDGVHTLNVWQQATRIWNTELKKLGASAAEASAFDAWTRSRNALMLLVYDADTATEMMAQAIMERVVKLCK